MSKKAVVWSQPNCPYCNMAKTLLQLREWEIEEKVLGFNGITREDFLEANPGMKTVPQIYLNGTHIGGYDKLKVMLG